MDEGDAHAEGGGQDRVAGGGLNSSMILLRLFMLEIDFRSGERPGYPRTGRPSRRDLESTSITTEEEMRRKRRRGAGSSTPKRAILFELSIGTLFE